MKASDHNYNNDKIFDAKFFSKIEQKKEKREKRIREIEDGSKKRQSERRKEEENKKGNITFKPDEDNEIIMEDSKIPLTRTQPKPKSKKDNDNDTDYKCLFCESIFKGNAIKKHMVRKHKGNVFINIEIYREGIVKQFGKIRDAVKIIFDYNVGINNEIKKLKKKDFDILKTSKFYENLEKFRAHSFNLSMLIDEINKE